MLADFVSGFSARLEETMHRKSGFIFFFAVTIVLLVSLSAPTA